MNEVNDHNKRFKRGEVSFTCRPNSRAVLTTEEKRFYTNGLAFDENKSKDYHSKINNIEGRTEPKPQPKFPQAPESLDYRKLGYVTEVVDQGEHFLDFSKTWKSSKAWKT